MTRTTRPKPSKTKPQQPTSCYAPTYPTLDNAGYTALIASERRIYNAHHDLIGILAGQRAADDEIGAIGMPSGHAYDSPTASGGSVFTVDEDGNEIAKLNSVEAAAEGNAAARAERLEGWRAEAIEAIALLAVVARKARSVGLTPPLGAGITIGGVTTGSRGDGTDTCPYCHQPIGADEPKREIKGVGIFHLVARPHADPRTARTACYYSAWRERHAAIKAERMNNQQRPIGVQ